MAIIKPFRALRPTPALADKIADLPYDVMNSAEARVMVADNPYSFLRIDRGEINFPEPVDPYQPQVYQKAHSILKQMIEQGHYQADSSECLYIYRQIMGGRSQTGLVCTTSVDDYINDVIKKHEHTHPDKEIDRAAHIEAVGAHTGPILQTFPDHEAITSIIENWASAHQPVYQFTAYNVEQICWVIDDKEVIAELQSLFASVPHIYTVQNTTAVQRLAGGIKNAGKILISMARKFNYFLSVSFGLKLNRHNRVSEIGTLWRSGFGRIQERFLQSTPATMLNAPHQFGMFQGKWSS